MSSNDDLLDAERDLCGGSGPDAVVDRVPGNVAAGATWGEERTVRARTLLSLLCSDDGTGGLRARVARLRGVRIVERLDMTGREFNRLELIGCFVDEQISLDGAKANSVKLVGCHLPKGLTARGFETRGDLTLRELVSTQVRLKNAHIGGQLDFTDTRLRPAEPTFDNDGRVIADTTSTSLARRALDADGLLVDRSMICRRLKVRGAVHIPRARISGVLNLDRALLSNPSGEAFRGDRIWVGHGMFCRDGFLAIGEMRLPRAHVGGQLSFRGAELSNQSQRALYAHGLRVDHNMVCTPSSNGRLPFKVHGEIGLLGAHIGGQLDFSGAQLHNSAGPALQAERLRVDQDVFCRAPFTAHGEVSLEGAHVGGQLDFSGAELTAHPEESALNGDGLRVDQSMFCARHRQPRAAREPRARTRRRPRAAHRGQWFRASGTVSLLGARVGGQLDFSGATLDHSAGLALSADGLRVDQDMFCREQFVANGEISLQGARIGGQLDCFGATLINLGGLALNADGLRVEQGMFCETRHGDSFSAAGKVCLPRAVIGGEFVWRPKRAGHISLYRARVGSLVDSYDSWPPHGQLDLEHFVYDGFGSASPDSAKDRISWLKRQPDFKSQPYQQLLGVYRAHGHDADARKVAMARERARRTQGKPGVLGWLGSAVLGGTIRYGYTPALAAVYLVAVYALGVWTFSKAAEHGAFIPVRATRQTAQATAPPSSRSGDPAPSASECHEEDRYPCLDPWGYAADIVVPLVNLHQAEFWQPDATKPFGPSALWYGWIATALGWALTTLAVAGFTGLVRRE